MNKIFNDRMEFVDAVGAPGSIARLECEYPKLIEILQEMSDLTDDQVSVALKVYDFSPMEIENLLYLKNK